MDRNRQQYRKVDQPSRTTLLQPRLTIGPVDDPYEREAERVADEVLRMPAPSIQRAPVDLTSDWLTPLARRNGRGAGGEGQLQRCSKCAGKPVEDMCPDCAAKAQAEQGLLQRSADGATPEVTSAIEGQIQALRGGGQPLDGEVRSFMEPRFGYDFGGVRVHTGPQAAQAASSVNALAFTLGNDVVFGTGQYQPGSEGGKRLIAHELTHVVQQGTALSRKAMTLNEQGLSVKNFPRSKQNDDSLVLRFSTKSQVNQIQRHKKDLVGYTGGQRGLLFVLSKGIVTYVAPAVSGHPGHGENEPGEGPIPTGTYHIHPKITQRPVTSLESGTCGANGISAGYQEISSDDPSPCEGSHYCNVPCATLTKPDQKCFTPRDCWGPYRIKIEGSKSVVTPSHQRKVRSGFFIHGGNPGDAVSSGCIKSLDNTIFTHIRSLDGVKGKVPLCVGAACWSHLPK